MANKLSTNHFFAFILMVFIIAKFCIFIYLNSKPAKHIKMGDPIPPLTYLGTNHVHQLVSSDSLKTLVMLFHPECDHCLYELSLLDHHKEYLEGINLVLLTTDNTFNLSRTGDRWPNLHPAFKCAWGIVEKDTLKKYMGSFGLPAFFVFNKSGMLTDRLIGETKFSKLRELLSDEPFKIE